MKPEIIIIILLLVITIIGVWGFTKPPQETRDPKPGYIYVIGNPLSFGENRNWYKVGLSVNPKQRRSQFNTAAPYDYKIYATIHVEDMFLVEGDLHRRLRKYRIRKNREWFEVDRDTIYKIIKKYCSKDCQLIIN